MIYPIYVYGMPVLRRRAREIDEHYPNLNQLIQDMFETMYHSDGMGLAAPQIGLSIRMLVIDAAPVEDESDPTLKDFKKVFINPQITEEAGEEWSTSEGCLSIPNIREDVSRKPLVRIQYYNEKFEFFDEQYDGVKARIIQHEMDHLNGVLFTDRISPLRKRLLQPKLKAISRGEAEVKYRMIFPKK